MNTFKKILLSIASVAVVGGATASLILLANDAKETDAASVTSSWDNSQIMSNPFFKNDGFCYSPTIKAKVTYLPTEQKFSLFQEPNITVQYFGTSDFSKTTINGHIYQLETYFLPSTTGNQLEEVKFLETTTSNWDRQSIIMNSTNINGGEMYGQIKLNMSTLPNKTYFAISTGDVATTINVNYYCVFDLTNIYGGGKEPDADTFHKQFLGYEAGYSAGVADGSKTQVTTSINNFSTVQNLNNSSYPSSPAYYSSKSVGSYSSTASNLYWSSSAYGNNKITRTETNNGQTVLIQNNEEMTYFQVANYTKYLNTTKTDISFAPTINLTVPSGSFSWKVYYTTQDMSQWNDVSSWQTTSPIVPSDAFLANCELVSSWALDDVYLGQGLTASGTKKEITDSTFSMFIIMTVKSGALGSLNDLSNDKIFAGSVTTTFTMDKSLSINYEVVDLPAFFYTLLTAPFSFISTAFNVTLFNGTPYALNISSLIMGVLGSALIIIVIKIIGGIIKSL